MITTNPEELFRQAIEQHKRGRYDEAESLYRQARNGGVGAFGENHAFVQDVVEKLARLYVTAGRYEKARQALQKLRTLKEKAYGEHHPSVARVVRLLFEVLQHEGKRAEADVMGSLCMDIWVDFLGPVETQQTDLSNFDAMYGARSRLGGTDWIADRLKTRMKVSPDEPQKYRKAMFTAHSEIGAALKTRGGLTAAAQNFEAALRVMDETPDMIWEYSWIPLQLASIYLVQKKHRQAESILLKYLEPLDKTYGNTHDVAASFSSLLGTSYGGQKRVSESAAAFRRAIAVQEHNLESAHPSLADTYTNYAETCRQCGNGVEAEGFLRRALKIREEALGHDNLLVADSLYALGELLLDGRRYAEAEPVLQRSAKILETKLGPQCERVSVLLDALGRVYIEQSKYFKAEVMLVRSLDIKKLVLPSEHIRLATGQNELGYVYLGSGKYVDAQVCYEHALSILDKHQSQDVDTLAESLSKLGRVFFLQCKYPESEQFYKRAIETIEDSSTPDEIRLASVLVELAELCVCRRKFNEAERLSRQVKAMTAHATSFDVILIRSRAALISGWLLAFAGNHVAAQAQLADAENGLESISEASASKALLLLSQIGQAYLELGSVTRARDAVEKGRALAARFKLEEDCAFASILELSARISMSDRMADFSIADLKQALNIREKTQGTQHPDFARSQLLLATAHCRNGNIDRAEECCHKAIQIMDRTVGSQHTELAGALVVLSGICYRRGFPQDACQLVKRAVPIWSRAYMLPDFDLFEQVSELVVILRNADQVVVLPELTDQLIESLPSLVGLYTYRVSSRALELAKFLITRGCDDIGIAIVNRLLDICERNNETSENWKHVRESVREFAVFVKNMTPADKNKLMAERLNRYLAD